jgi:hypothetical protein
MTRQSFCEFNDEELPGLWRESRDRFYNAIDLNDHVTQDVERDLMRDLMDEMIDREII